MKKYIDADLLKAEFTGNFACEYPAPLVKALIDNQPVADVAEVVRCKDCKCFKKDNGGSCSFGSGLAVTNRNEYCSYGAKIDKE